MVLVITARNGNSLQGIMDFTMSLQVHNMHRQMAKLKKVCISSNSFSKKPQTSKSDPYLDLLSYRTAPLEFGLSPAELLMNSRLRTTLPSYKDIKENAETQTKLENTKWKQKQRYDKSTRTLRPLAKDDVVRIQDQDAWN